MATEYRLSYTAADINEKLGKIDSLAEKSEIPSATSDLINDSGFLTSIPHEYITEAELNAKGYLTEHQDLSDYALASEIPSVDGLASEDYVSEQIGFALENSGAVLYNKQELTDEQKKQARDNIGAGEHQIQSDWNQTDETAPNYVKNRTHYDVIRTVEVNETCNVGSWCYGNRELADLLMSDNDLSNITVTIDGTEYALVYDNYSDHWNLKDGGIYSIHIDNYDGYGMFICHSGAPDGAIFGTATFTGYYEERHFKQLDPKYLPEALQFGERTENIGNTLFIGKLNEDDVDESKLVSEIDAYCISNAVVTMSDLQNGCIITTTDGTMNISAEDIRRMGYGIINIGDALFCVGENAVGVQNLDMNNAIFPQAGIYTAHAALTDGVLISLTIPGYNFTETTLHTLDPKYIKDMYYEAPVEVFSVENAEFINRFYQCEPTFAIVEGKTYIVNWDGVEYTCEAYIVQDIPVIGNTADFGGTGNGEPFYMGYDNTNNVSMVCIFDDSGAHTFSIMETDIHPIDPKYLPDSVKTQSDWNQNDEAAIDFIKNKPTLATSEEVKALFN